MAAIFKAVFFLIVALGLVAAGVTKGELSGENCWNDFDSS